MGTTLSAVERAALLELIGRQARAAQEDVNRLRVERLADFERDAAERYNAKIEIKDLIAECYAKTAPLIEEIRAIVEACCDTHDIPAELRPHIHASSGVVSIGHPGTYAWRLRLEALQRVAKTDIEAAARRARTAIEHARTEAEARVLAPSTTTDEEQAILATIPAAETLLPPLDLPAIEAGGRHER